MNTATTPNGRQAVTTEQTTHDPALLDRVIEATRYSVRDVETMARQAAKSRLFGLDEAQAFTMMMIAEATGLHPMLACLRYDVIDGKPAMKAAAMQAEFQRRGGRIVFGARTNEVCEAMFSHPVHQPKPMAIRWTLDDLKKNGVALARDGSLKQNYRRSPRAMLHARVISEGVRAIDPGIVVGLYTPEEISDSEDRGLLHDELEPEAADPPEVKPADPEPSTAPRGPLRAHDPMPPTHAERVSELRQFTEDRLTKANDGWRNILLLEGKGDLYKPLVKHPRQIAEHLRGWLKVPDESLPTTRAERNAAIGGILNDAWDRDPMSIKAEIISYLGRKLCEAAAAAEVELSDDVHVID